MRSRIELLGGVAPFALLPSATLERLANALREERFAKDEVVISEGEVGGCLYLIVEGRAEATTGNPADPILLESYGEGEAFGELALLESRHVRRATVAAVTDLCTLSLDAVAVSTLMAEHPEMRQSIEQLRERLLLIKLLKLAAPFTKLDVEFAKRLTERLQQQLVGAGVDIVREGEQGDACYLLRSGKVAVLSRSTDGVEVELARLAPPTIFGEAALLADIPRNATARSLEPCELLVLRRQDLLATVEADARVSRSLIDLMLLRDRPKQAENIIVSQREAADGGVITTLKDPRRAAYFQLSAEGYLVWSLLDGNHTLRDLALAHLQRFGAFTPDAVANTVRSLDAAGFLEPRRLRPELVKSAGPSRQQRLVALGAHALDWQLSLRNIDPWLARLYRRGIWILYTRPALIVVAALTVAGLVVSLLHFGPARREVVGGGWELGLLIGASFLAIVFHEAGHAFTVKAFGREVPRAGIGWYWFGPMAYVDTSDMWLADRWPRIAVSLGGPLASLLLASSSAIAAALVGHSLAAAILWQLAFIAYWTQLLNLNPLLEFDGYFVLMDLLDRPNLRRHCLDWLRRDLLGALRDRARLRQHRLELLYGCGSILYVLAATYLTLDLGEPLLENWLHAAMPLLAAAVLAWFFAATIVVLSLVTLVDQLFLQSSSATRAGTVAAPSSGD